MKIANKIIVSFMVAAVAIAAVGSTVFYLVIKNDLKAFITGYFKTVAESRVAHLDTYLKLLEISSAQFSKSIIIEIFLKTPKDDPSWQRAFNDVMERLRRTKDANPEIYEFFVTDTTGRIVASSEIGSIGKDLSGDAGFLEGIKRVYIKDAFYSDDMREPLLLVSAPFKDRATERTIGVIVAKVRLSGLYRIVTDTRGLGRTGEIFIVNQYGYMISPSRFIKDTFLKKRVDTVNLRMSSRVDGEDKIAGPMVIGRDYRGVVTLGTHGHVPKMKWRVLFGMDLKEAFGPLARIFYVWLTIMALIPLVAWLIGSFMARVITDPIRKLREGAEIVGSGRLEYQVGTDSSDEIGDLSRAFDSMTKDLRKKSVSIDILNEEVAEREKAELTSERLSAIVESSDDAIIGKDVNGVITSWNRGAERIYGYRPEEAIGKTSSIIIPEDKIDEEAVMLESIKNGKSVHHYETERRRRDGERIVVSLTLSPIRDREGHVIGASSISRNVTERKAADVALKESERKIRAILDQTFQFIGMMTPDGVLIEINRAALDLVGASPAEVMGKPFWQTRWWSHSPELQQRLKDAVKRAANGELVRFEATHPSRSGTLHYVDFSLKPVRDDGGKVVYLIPEGRDITARKKAETVLKEAYDDLKKAQIELIQAEKMVALGRFSYGAAHEIKNPLGIILGGTEYLEAKYKDADQDTRETIDTVVAAVKRADRIIDMLVRFSEPKRSKVETVLLDDIVKRSVEKLKKGNIDPRIGIAFKFSQEGIFAEVEADRVEDAMQEILRNAVEAMPEGGIINIRTYKESTREFLEDVLHGVIEIADSGEGMPKESLPKVFEPFFTTKRDKKQVGLGLTVARAIVNINKGDIFVSSEKDKGTVVKVALPLAAKTKKEA
jgi:PAS domain S-box-containing protein